MGAMMLSHAISCVRVFVCSCVRVFVCSCVRVFVCWCVRGDLRVSHPVSRCRADARTGELPKEG